MEDSDEDEDDEDEDDDEDDEVCFILLESNMSRHIFATADVVLPSCCQSLDGTLGLSFLFACHTGHLQIV